MSNAIADAIKKAQETAAGAAAPGGAVVPASGGGAPALPGRKLSMADMQGAMSVDKWLKVTEFGLRVGDSKDFKDSIKVKLDMTEGFGFMLKMAIKYGNPAQYKNTYDGVTAVGGGRWADAVATAQQIDAKANPYRSADLPLIATEAVLDTKANNAVLVEAGKVLGHSTSTTNWRNWEMFFREVEQKGLLNKWVDIDLGWEPKSGNGNKWGVVTFRLIGESAVQGKELA